jgi:hypothetical protein
MEMQQLWKRSSHRASKPRMLLCSYLVDNSGKCLFRIAASPTMAGADRPFLRLLLLAVISSTPVTTQYQRASCFRAPPSMPEICHLCWTEGIAERIIAEIADCAWCVEGSLLGHHSPDYRIRGSQQDHRQSVDSPTTHRLCLGGRTSGTSTTLSTRTMCIG